MTTVAERGGFGFAATAGPDGSVLFYGHNFWGLAGAFMGAVTVRGILCLPTGAKGKGLAGFRVDFVGERLPTHGLIVRQSWKNERGKWGLRWKVEGGRSFWGLAI